MYAARAKAVGGSLAPLLDWLVPPESSTTVEVPVSNISRLRRKRGYKSVPKPGTCGLAPAPWQSRWEVNGAREPLAKGEWGVMYYTVHTRGVIYIPRSPLATRCKRLP